VGLERWRLTLALLLSLLIHMLLLGLTFGGEELGLPGFGFPWQERRIEVPDLRIRLVPAQGQATEPAVTPVGEPVQQAGVEWPVSGRSAQTPPGSPATSSGQASVASPPEVQASAEANPTPVIAAEPSDLSPESAMSLPLRETGDAGAARINREVQARTAEVTLPDRAGQEEAQQQEAARQEFARQEEARQEAARVEVSRQEAVRQEVARVEATQLEATRQEAARQEAVRQEVLRVEATREEAARAEAAMREVGRAEATREEVARLEAARVDTMRQDAARQEATRIEATRQEAARQDAVRVEAARQEAERNESARQEAARQETERAEAIRREAMRQESARQESARQDLATKQEVARQEAVRVEAARQEAARQEVASVETARQEATRQEAARQEAARGEAARLEVARQEAERQEAAARREARLQEIGRQLNEEANRREAAAAAARLAPSSSSLRRGRLFGRSDANTELVLYAEAWARKIQMNMTFDMVREAAKQPHTSPVVTVAIRSDGSVESVVFVLSSGVAAIDEAIPRIVHSQANYQAFPPGLASEYDVIEIRRTWHFDMAIRLY
jgi:hypothetical protein